MDADLPWLTIPEAARRLGVTPQAIRKRLKRGALVSKRNNRGQEIVQVPVVPVRPQEPEPEAGQQEPVRQEPEPRSQARHGGGGLVSLADVRSMLGEQAERLHVAHNAVVATLREAADRQERQHQRHLDQVRADHVAVVRSLTIERRLVAAVALTALVVIAVVGRWIVGG